MAYARQQQNSSPYAGYRGIKEYLEKRILAKKPDIIDFLAHEGYDREQLKKQRGRPTPGDLNEELLFLASIDYMRTAMDITDAFKAFSHGQENITRKDVESILRRAAPDMPEQTRQELLDEMGVQSESDPFNISEMVVRLMYGERNTD